MVLHGRRGIPILARAGLPHGKPRSQAVRPRPPFAMGQGVSGLALSLSVTNLNFFCPDAPPTGLMNDYRTHREQP